MENHNINLRLIIEGCLANNPLSQRKLYELYYGYAMSIASLYGKNSEEAEEILNDGFMNVFKRIEQYDTSYSFKGWLRRIIINAAIDYHRKFKKFNTTYSVDQVPEQHEDGDQFAFEDGDDVLPIIQKLPPAYRMVFNLYVMEEYNHREIAELLEISVGTSKSNFARAKRKLKALWLEENQGSKKNKLYG